MRGIALPEIAVIAPFLHTFSKLLRDNSEDRRKCIPVYEVLVNVIARAAAGVRNCCKSVDGRCLTSLSRKGGDRDAANHL